MSSDTVRSVAMPAQLSIARAIGAHVVAILLFSTMNAVIKWLGTAYPISQMVFFRSLFALVVLAPMIHAAGGFSSLRTRRPLGHAWRAVAGVSAMACGFTAITLLPLANAAALGFTAPLFTTILGVLILGEKVRWRRTLAIIVGFAGVLVMLWPNLAAVGGSAALSPNFWLGSGLALVGSALAALAMISIRRLSGTEPSTTIVFYFMLLSTTLSGLLLPFEFVMPPLKDALLLVALGLLGGVAQVLMTRAYQAAPVAVIAPFDYTAMIWASLYGLLIWGDMPGPWVVAGALIVTVSGVYITLREVKLGVATAPPAKLRGELP